MKEEKDNVKLSETLGKLPCEFVWFKDGWRMEFFGGVAVGNLVLYDGIELVILFCVIE